MRTGLFVFPSDLVAHGTGEMILRAQEIGAPELAVAVAYHQARDVTPQDPDVRVRYREDGVFLPLPEPLWQETRLRPPVQRLDEVAATGRLFASMPPGTALAWTVFLHNTTLGERYPDVSVVNCFGDQLRADLCPANPDVAAYTIALASTVAVRTRAPVLAEALSYGTFEHGHHHERCFVPLGPGEKVLMGLCFCVHCGRSAGVDTDRLRAAVCRHLDAALAGTRPPTPATRPALSEVVGPDVDVLLTARQKTVTRLAERVATAVRTVGSSLIFLDLTGAVLGYSTGVPEGDPAGAQGWRLGIDVAELASVVDGYSCLAYARDPGRLAGDVRSVADAIGGRCPLRVVLRPGWPDTDDEAHLAAKLAACARARVDAVDFYHFGLYPQPVLARIPRALARTERFSSWDGTTQDG